MSDTQPPAAPMPGPPHVTLVDAMRPDDLDPLGMGLLPSLKCKACQRDRYNEYMHAPAADVVAVEGGSEILGVPCACGATLIEHGWFWRQHVRYRGRGLRPLAHCFAAYCLLY